MKETDKPLGTIDKHTFYSINPECLGEITCCICNSANTYDLIMHDDVLSKMMYSKGKGKYLCRDCYKDSLKWDKLAWSIITPWCKFNRFIENIPQRIKHALCHQRKNSN